MRRDYLWYGIAACWALAAAFGILRHHAQQAVPAIVFACLFLLYGIWLGKRDRPLRARRAAAAGPSDRESA